MFDASPRPELLSLLAAVKADPDDDTAKLVLADWLQEQDSEADRARGEFVRALVQYDLLGKYDPVPGVLSKSMGLVRLYETAWFGRLVEVGFRHCDNFAFSRWGLPFPSIDGVRLVAKAARAIANTEEYAWLAGILLYRISTTQLTRFANSPLLDTLIGLNIESCNVTESAITELVNSPRLAAMKRLVFEQEGVPAIAIANSPHLTKLRELQLVRAGLSDLAFKSLCDSPQLNDLRSLDVRSNSLSIHSARAFADCSGLPKLTELNLGGLNRIGPDGALILVASPNTGRLRKLNLWANGIADYGVEAICRQPHMNNLTHLDVSGNLLTDRAAIALAGAEHLKTLEELNLKTNSITGEGALAIARSPHLMNLCRVNLSGNDIGDKAAVTLRDRFGDRVIL